MGGLTVTEAEYLEELVRQKQPPISDEPFEIVLDSNPCTLNRHERRKARRVQNKNQPTGG